jgi:hypothetical protein
MDLIWRLYLGVYWDRLSIQGHKIRGLIFREEEAPCSYTISRFIAHESVKISSDRTALHPTLGEMKGGNHDDQRYCLITLNTHGSRIK